MGSKDSSMVLIISLSSSFAPGHCIKFSLMILLLLQWPLASVDSHEDKVLFCAMFLFFLFQEKGKWMICLFNFGYYRFYVRTGGRGQCDKWRS